MIDWLCSAFAFELRLKVEGDDGRIEHSEISFGEAVVMVGSERDGTRWGVNMLSPKTANGQHAGPNAVRRRRRRPLRAGPCRRRRIVDEPSVHDYGEDYWADRSYGALDPEGHMWWFSQRLRNKEG